MTINERDLEFFETLFAKLINIQKLKLCGTSDKWISLNLDKHLEFVYSELQVLNVSQITYSIAIEIIKKTTGSIQKIWADSMHIRNLSLNSNTGHFIQCISQFCPNLKYVRIALNDDYLDKLESLLTNCFLIIGKMKNLIEKYTNEGVIKKFQNCNFNDDKDFKWCY
uniref:Uncharacterized protein n=1 Tax=Rhizophagus irregularis (strain DAOM 181602 / DAOM 197198 / MUCL 43194) TaxID=747089 RepID=U9U7Y0_RHIID